MENTIIQNAINQVQNSASSIFSKDDVLNLLDSINVVATDQWVRPVCSNGLGAVTTDWIWDIVNDMDKDVDWYVDSCAEQVCEDAEVDNDDCEFCIGYDNKVELSEFGITESSIRGAISNWVESYVNSVVDAVAAKCKEQAEAYDSEDLTVGLITRADMELFEEHSYSEAGLRIGAEKVDYIKRYVQFLAKHFGMELRDRTGDVESMPA